MNDPLRQAIACIKSGNKVAAQQLLAQVIRADPRNEAAWLWMATTLDAPEKKEECLQRALQINPNSELAKKGLAQIGSSQPLGPIEPDLKEQASQARQRPASRWRGPMVVGAVLGGLFIAFVAWSLLPAMGLPGSPTKKDQPAATAVPPPSAATLKVPAGHLSEYIQDYSKYEAVLVYKKDGTLDERTNDLEELCRDWLYYRDKSLEYEASGQPGKAAGAKETFQEINGRLNDYDKNDVSAMISMLE